MFVPATQLSDTDAAAAGSWYVFDQRGSVLLVDGAVPTGVDAPCPIDNVHVLGVDDGEPVRVGQFPKTADPFDDVPEGGEFVNMRAAYGVIPDVQWAMAGRGSQVLLWDRDHRFCGRCGTETEAHETERSKVCAACKSMAFPRLAPAVIMLVERDGDNGPEVLLAWGRQFPGRFYSALAGFVEPGESLEECVVREVREETGIEVSDVRYFGSQPWPFPNSMMIGFTARYESGEIAIQEEEIVEADWYGPDDLPPAPIGGMSIAGWLIEDWLARVRSS